MLNLHFFCSGVQISSSSQKQFKCFFPPDFLLNAEKPQVIKCLVRRFRNPQFVQFFLSLAKKKILILRKVSGWLVMKRLATHKSHPA